MLYAMLYIHMHNHVYCRYGTQLTSTLNGVIFVFNGSKQFKSSKATSNSCSRYAEENELLPSIPI